jgi:short-subunit dehydrogenase
MTNVLVIGATSAIAHEVTRLLAPRGDRFFLLARDEERLTLVAKDVQVRGAASVATRQLDVDDLDAHQPALDAAFDELGSVDVVLVAHGTLPDQARSEAHVDEALGHLHTNAVATASLLLHLANRLEGQGAGTLAVISSVAGDRGRRSNYVYGSAKAMVSTMVHGLRARLAPAGVTVIDVKPGFVDTPMTASFDKGLLWAQPSTVASKIVAVLDRGPATVYTPWFWRPIMTVVRLLPDPIFRRLPL